MKKPEGFIVSCQNPEKRKALFSWGLFGIVLLGIAGFILLSGLTAYPVPYTDGVCYLIPSINLKAGHGFVNQVIDYSYLYDTTGKAKFNYYVPLFFLTLAAMIRHPHPVDTLAAIALINLASLFLSAYLFYRAARWKQPLRLFSAGLMSLCLLGLATSFPGHYGCRPEILATFVFVCGASWLLKFKTEKPWIVLGICLGLMAASYPPGSIVFGIGIGLYYSLTRKTKSVILFMALTCGIALAVFFLVLGCSPYGISETLSACLKHIKNERAVSVRQLIRWGRIFFYPTGTFYASMILLAIGVFVDLLRIHWSKVASKTLTVLGMACFFFAVNSLTIKFGGRRTAPLYLFSPAFFVILIYRMTHPPIQNRWWKWLMIFLVALCCAGFVRSALLYPFYEKEGVKLEQARQIFSGFVKQKVFEHRILGISESMWVLSEDYDRMVICQGWTGRCDLKNENLVIFWQQQASGWGEQAPEIHLGFKKIWDNFVPSEPRIFGIKLAHTIPGYAFAIYVPPDQYESFKQQLSF
ncbi:MAG: hypothetical protein EXS63_03725 [Candidatus Omnitrophica bacterium]|nr:hypothetical protein [Candidatus Omnitrophota bacterium]